MTPELQQLLSDWYLAREAAIQAKEVIEKEMGLRKRVADALFPTPKEGTNTAELGNGWKLKYLYKIDRKIDEATLAAIKEQLRERNVNPDQLIRMKPELATAAYKDLIKIDPQSALIFDQTLIIKPASPTLELVSPKETK